jgi:hypothetical protein
MGVWATRSVAVPSRIVWRDDRALYPQGVASGDPDEHSIVLWTRRPFDQGDQQALMVEVALDADFRRVVATARVPVLAAADWTCRALVGGLLPATILTDLHSYKAADPTDRPEAQALDSGEYPVIPQEWLEIVDAGKDYAGGKPPAIIALGDKSIPNFRKDEPAHTVLGREQKAWLKEQLTKSTATWKIWGLTNGPLDMRTASPSRVKCRK